MTTLRLVLAPSALALALAASGCILGPLSLEDRPCPCAAGWRCDALRDVCVRGCTTRADCRGAELCVAGGCVLLDAGPPCTPENESCNGMNDDCDGAIDEGSGLCSLAQAIAACTSGACAITSCQAGFADCDRRADNGCETALGTTTDCGACDAACTGMTPFCAPGAGGALACVASCPAGFDECGGSCVDVDTDVHHCGACDDACSPEHGVGRCTMGTCAVATCDARWADCDTDVANGCEASLDGDTSCGGCTVDCTATTAGTCAVGRCVGGACITEPGGPGETCRRASSVCDVAEVCTATGTCPPDRFAPVGTACRSSLCGGLDPREFCTGTSAECPAPCGCDGEPCCTGATGCAFPLECRGGTCTPCSPAGAALSGGFPMPEPPMMTLLRSVTATGGSITMVDGKMATGTIMLGGGVTATGSFAPPCAMFCDWLTTVTASGDTITFTSGGVTGGTTTMGTITLVGATATGSVTATRSAPTVAGYFARVTTSGDVLTFTDQMMVSGTITLTRAAACMP